MFVGTSIIFLRRDWPPCSINSCCASQSPVGVFTNLQFCSAQPAVVHVDLLLSATTGSKHICPVQYVIYHDRVFHNYWMSKPWSPGGDASMSVISRCVGLVAVKVQLSNRGVAGEDGSCYLKLCLCLGCTCGAGWYCCCVVSLSSAKFSAISHVTLVFSSCKCEGRVGAKMFAGSRTTQVC